MPDLTKLVQEPLTEAEMTVLRRALSPEALDTVFGTMHINPAQLPDIVDQVFSAYAEEGTNEAADLIVGKLQRLGNEERVALLAKLTTG